MTEQTSYALIQVVYWLVAISFILGLKRMSSPVTARSGVIWAGVGMVVATLVTFLLPQMANFGWIVAALVLGVGLAWWSGRVVKMTDMPQMVAIYNGMGGGAAAAIAALEFMKVGLHGGLVGVLALAGAFIGSLSFSGSLVAFAKLQGWMNKAYRLPLQNVVNVVLLLLTLGVAGYLYINHETLTQQDFLLYFALALLLGVVMTLPIGGADMPVVISLFNAFTGLAVGFEGYVLNNPSLIVAGIVVGAAGMLLTQLMAKAMNRPLTNILFTPMAATGEGAVIEGTMREVTAGDAAAMLRYAQKVLIVPGYGMAVAQAQHKVWEMSKLLIEAGVEVKFAIHPVAGRMPGHMNVLLAESGVPYEIIADLDEINEEFENTDVALVIGANDVVNPVARFDKTSPIYGMPILNADKARNVLVIKRGKGSGYSGVENALFYAENTNMVYGSAQTVVNEMVHSLKTLL